MHCRDQNNALASYLVRQCCAIRSRPSQLALSPPLAPARLTLVLPLLPKLCRLEGLFPPCLEPDSSQRRKRAADQSASGQSLATVPLAAHLPSPSALVTSLVSPKPSKQHSSWSPFSDGSQASAHTPQAASRPRPRPEALGQEDTSVPSQQL